MTNNDERKFKATFSYVSTDPAADQAAWSEALNDMLKLKKAGFNISEPMSATTPEEHRITFGVW